MEAFLTRISKFYNDKFCWALASKEKLKELADLNEDGDGVLKIRDNKVILDMPVTLANLVSLFQDMRLRYNDRKGTRDIVIFMGADFTENMQLKCEVKMSNDTVILVDPETLNFIENPDIASIPQTSEEYCLEFKNIEPLQIAHLLSPQSLSPLQEKLMSYHNRLHHLPWPKLMKWQKMEKFQSAWQL